MRQFQPSDEFKDDFRQAARRYFREVERSEERARKVEAARLAHGGDTWQVDLAEALQRRAWERLGRAEWRLTLLIRSLSGGEPVPGSEVYDEPGAPIGSFPAVECLGSLFMLVGEEQHFVVRPTWMQVRIDAVD